MERRRGVVGPRDAPAGRLPAVAEVLLAFAGLGLRCFGGPVAHLGYFRVEFVERRRWLDERQFADIVGLCQFLPGPASSQTGFALGLLRGGYLGGLAAWVGFTLPSALLMLGFAFGAARVDASAAGAGLLHGLKLAAVAIVAQAVRGMATALCPDLTRRAIAAVAVALVLLAPAAAGQIAAIGLGAAAGLLAGRRDEGGDDGGTAGRGSLTMPVSRLVGIACLALFTALLLGLPLLTAGRPVVMRFDGFYRAGALVFGGGHVVLPLLRDAVVLPGWVSDSRFLAGYGAAQALPGPLFSMAAFLGATMTPAPFRVLGATLALVAIFLPGLLLLTGILPFWDALRRRAPARAAMRGANAATVGILALALYDPLGTTSVHSIADVAIAAAGFILLAAWRCPPLLVVALASVAGICVVP